MGLVGAVPILPRGPISFRYTLVGTPQKRALASSSEPIVRLLHLSFLLFLALVTLLPAQRPELERSSANAKRLLDEGKFKEAIPLLLELQKAAPTDVGLGMNLGNAYAASGDFAAAVQTFESLRRNDPAFAPAALSLAGIYLNQGREREAITLLREQVAREPRNGEARNMLASAYRITGDLTRANEERRELARLSPKNARAQHLLYQSYQEIAQESFGLAEQAAPESAYMVAMAGYQRLASEEYASAFYLMREALRRKSDLRGPHSALATIYAKTGHADWAALESKQEPALSAEACNADPLACAFEKGDLPALMQATRFARLPEDLYWRYRAAHLLAEKTYATLQSLPKSVNALGAKAERERRLGRHTDAVASWKAAIALAPGNAGLEKELVVSLYQAKDFVACAQRADALLKTHPEDGDLQLIRGDAALSQQDAKTALPYLEKAVALNPAMLPAHASLGRALLLLGRAADALPHLEQALPYDRDGSILYQYAQACQQSGRTEQAKVALARYQDFLKKDRAEKAEFEARFQIVAP